MKNTIFISDIHLSQNNSTIVDLFLNFLKNISPETETIYILGDLFEFWVGDDDTSDFNQQIKKAIANLHEKNTQVYIMPGNRDFLLGAKFASDCKAILLDDPAVINLYGKPTLLTHGDILCTNDYGLRIFRFFTNRKFLRKLFLATPLSFRTKLAKFIRQLFSRKLNKIKPVNINHDKITSLMKANQTKLIIHGHTHHQIIEASRIVLSDWQENKTYILIYYENHSFSIK